jgi:hypothetical protein
MTIRPLFCAAFVAVFLSGAAAAAQTTGAVATMEPATSTVVGKIGIGASTSNAPIGVRMWLSPSFGFDAGLGLVLNGNEPAVDDPDATQTTADWAVDVGGLMSLYTGDNSIAFGRLGLNIDRRYAPGSDADGPIDSSTLTFAFGPEVGVELFMTWLGFPELSLQGSVALNFAYVRGAEAGGERPTDWAFGSVSNGLNLLGTTQFGFHYYF